MQDAGIDLIPSNDFSSTTRCSTRSHWSARCPSATGWGGDQVDLDTYFAMARGRQTDGVDVTAMEMTKWFDTNYHYIVPELGPDTRFSLSSSEAVRRARRGDGGARHRHGPGADRPASASCCSPSRRRRQRRFDRLDLIEPLVEVYGEVIERLAEQGATWVQFDEPCFVEDRSEKELDALRLAYEELCKVHERPRIVVKTYFDHVGDAYGVLRDLPIEGVGLDFTGSSTGSSRHDVHEHGGRHNAEFIANQGGLDDKWLFAGIVDGRNVWIDHLEHSLDAAGRLCRAAPRSSSSRRAAPASHPIDLDAEPAASTPTSTTRCAPGWRSPSRRSARSRPWRRGMAEGREAIADELDANDRALGIPGASRARTRNAEVRGADRGDSTRSTISARARSRSAGRRSAPASTCRSSPSTTIGSYPADGRDPAGPRKELRKGEIDWAAYKEAMRAEIEKVIRFQEDVGLDVLVHGEPERNDMVQYFGEQMEGYVFTENAWVQSYGSRYVRPPIIFGDVLRPSQMTVDWITYAQSLTEKPVKGMLTGPVTMLEWSFVRDDQPLAETCKQLALAIRDEVEDLEKAGIQIIQVDEPAIREGLPLRKDRWDEYLSWAVHCFRLATAVVKDETQIQTHMCYSDFGDILEHIQAMDADVNLIEAARSRMELLHDWERTGYRNDIGPGVYDIHSPRVPTSRRWSSCSTRPHGAATRADLGQPRLRPQDPHLGRRSSRSLRNMVQAAKQLREELVPAS